MFYQSISSAGNGLLNNLISVWDLDETTGTTVYDSHGSYNGTNSGATINQTGVTNITPCYYFNGTSSYVYISDNNDLDLSSSNFSISLWVNITSLSQDVGFISKETAGTNGWMCYLGVTDGLHFSFFGYGLSTSGHNEGSVLSTGTWYHFVITFDGTYIKIYKNGSLSYTSSSLTGTITASTRSLWFGRYNSQTTRRLNGYLDQISIANGTTWDSTQVAALYGLGNGLAYINFTAAIENKMRELWQQFYYNEEIQIPLRIAV